MSNKSSLVPFLTSDEDQNLHVKMVVNLALIALRGTSQFWFKQRSRLISMVDTLGMPTVFFTHSAADGQWPELARLICSDKKDSSTSRSKAVSDNPAIADWFFYHRISKFVDTFYTDVMGAVDFCTVKNFACLAHQSLMGVLNTPSISFACCPHK